MRLRATTTLMLALAAGLAAGCGSDDDPEGAPIPEQAAVDLESRLAEVERRLEAGGGACADIQNDTMPSVEAIVASLPSDVDADVRDALQESFDRLFQLSEQQCDEEAGQETEAEPPAAIEPDTETTETLPPEEDEDGDEEEEEPPPTEEPPEVPPGQDGELPPGQGGDNPGQGNGGGALVPGEDD